MENIVFAHSMKCYCGKNAAISRVCVGESGLIAYRIEGMGCWNFTEQMFDLNYCGGGESSGT